MKWAFRHIHEYLFSSEYFHYKIFIHEKCLENKNDNFQENLSRPGKSCVHKTRARFQQIYS
jgi:hypothetical protein